ncbi:MAG: tRNA (adenosine(37)-N6)-threonylcarbamoyltransferase complex ATPase subunit type 1 TsaE [Proteobacteria bacterium]|nr:tRNA (adenosine(37)-N6)-threonylcarbamoyltransferase complex ATPase subunit type 1 TsaE [Pseudomonadota bacterium]
MSFMKKFEPLMSQGQSVVLEAELSAVEAVIDGFLPYVRSGGWIFLNGDLGTGKTTFTQVLLKKLGFAESVSSPTFAVMNVNELAQPQAGISRICHLDLYRLKKSSELCHLGLELEFRSHTLCIFEWAEVIDPEGWQYFFNTTGCKRPTSLITVSLTHTSDASVRAYSFVRESLQTVLGF